MNAEQLYRQIRQKKSFLCVGLDPEPGMIPEKFRNSEYPLFEFNREILAATHHLAVACKPNTAFYESHGTHGWKQLELTLAHIREHYPDLFVIADAKRGDIGNTSKKYAETFFGQLQVDAVTVAPYMGSDSVLPFLDYPGKWVVVLALTSNQGADDFQFILAGNAERLFETVLRKAAHWGNTDNMMFVVGATRAPMLVKVREIVPDHFLLVPGIGAQGGDLDEVARYGMNEHCGLLVNSSRGIIHADSTERFAQVAGEKAGEIQRRMNRILVEKGLV